MKRNQHIFRQALIILCVLTTHLAWSQVTTATLSGLVTDSNGEALVGVTVSAEHVPSGTYYGAVTSEKGRFVMPNLRVGGPYKVTTTYTGYKTYEETGIYLNLAQKLVLNMKMEEASATLGEVVITAETGAVLNGQRTGASTNISNATISRLPTISRSASDFYRLTPASDGNSFAGRNDQFNNFSLDGTIFNNPFGLDAATPGGQTDAQPVSLDAIEQIQVSLAPYDVTQSGFTGAAINAVTKSGTNEFKGTAFGFFRNQNMIGSKVGKTDSPVPDIQQGQYGFALGGPIVKNKVFFFVNAEIERRQDLGTAGFVAARPGLEGASVSRVQAADMEAVRNALKKYNYETGDYEGFKHNTYNNKALVKLDFNLDRNHKLTFTGNWLDAYKQKPAHPSAIGRRGPDATTLQFRNSGYRINNVIYSGIAELKSVFGNRVSNKMQVGYSAFRDTRDPFSQPFPVINISNGDGIRYIIAGHEPFSINNKLNQDVFQINDQVNIFLGQHTLTVGGAFEKFQFDNSFNLNAYGGTFGPGFASVKAFLDSVSTGAFDKDVKAARDAHAALEAKGQGVAGGWALAETNVGQLSFYLQDEIAVTDNLNLTLGMRVDRPLYFNTAEKIQENIDRNCCYFPDIQYYSENGEKINFDHTQLPKANTLFSPRIGFNWDVKGDRSSQLRGGSGLFTGRFPFVWVGNQVANPNFFFYCMTDPNFQFPQVWRNSLGFDQKFGGGYIASVDLIHTRDQNAVMVRNQGLRPPSGRLKGVDNRPIYTGADRTSFGNNAYVVGNTELGRTFNATFQLQRNWSNDFYASIGYNFGVAEDASSIDAEISSDAFDRNPAYGNVNQAVLTNSLYGNRHRVVGSLSKRFAYANGKLATTISAFFQYVQGGRYSYTYSGDLNGDGSFLNDLIYIPTDAEIEKMAFNGDAAGQRKALRDYILQDEYLSANRGQVAERFIGLNPWYNNWDIRILQDLNLNVAGKKNTIQLSIDILNAGNLINSEWGVRQLPRNTQPIGVSVDATGTPTYSFDPTLNSTYTQDPNFLSRWQAQVGLRYIF